MKDDPTIAQIREIRRRISALCGHDPKRIVKYYIAFQKKYQERLINLAKIDDAYKTEVVGTESVTKNSSEKIV